MNHGKIKKIVTIGIIVAAVSFAMCSPVSAELKYELLESFPGFFSKGDNINLPDMILAIYKLGIWTVGIAGLLMITIGGVMYMGSAGNNASAESAKRIITDALIGIVAALGAYLFMYVINPDLTIIKLSLTTANTSTTSATKTTGTTTETKGTDSDCSLGACNQANYTNLSNAISSNSYGIDSKIMKALLIGGEGCNKSQPPPSQSSSACGYSQVLGKYRKLICGLTGTNAETCKAVQNDIQLDVNCGAAVVKEQAGWCKKGTSGIDRVARCYGDQTERYVTKATNYYVTCK